MAIYQLPDGRKFNVPDSIPRDVAVKRLQEKFGKKQEPPQVERSTAPQIPQEQRSNVGADLARQVGLTGRAVTEGALSIPALAANPLAAGLNKLLGTNFSTDQTKAFADAFGLPEAETSVERVVQEAAKAATAGGTLAGLAKQVAPKFASAFDTLVEAASGAGAGAAAQTAQELGLPAPVQVLAGVGGGVAGLGAQRGLQKVPQLFADAPSATILKDVEAGTAFPNVREMLSEEGTRRKDEINQLFTQAEETGKNAFVSNVALDDLSSQLKSKAADSIDDEARKLYNAASSRVGALMKGKASLNDLESLRRAASQASQRNYAGGVVAREVDSFLDDALERGLITGDRQAVNTWKNAISARRDFGRKFEDPKAIAKAITDDTIESVEQTFLGGGDVAVKKDLGNIYDATLEALPKEQQLEAGNELRRAIVNRMVKRAIRTTDAEDSVSARFLANQIRNLRRENKSVWSKFPDEEKRILNNLEAGLRKEAEGGAINKVYNAAERLLRFGMRSNVELPRTLKPKTTVTIDDLQKLINYTPPKKGGALGATQPTVQPLIEPEQPQEQ